MRAVVAGATGFLGGYLLETLLQQGHEAVALVRKGSDLRLVDQLGVEKRFSDMLDAESLGQALRGVEIVFNAAGKVADWGPWREFDESNVRGTAYLLLAAIQNGVKRFVQVSSVAAYGMRFFGSQTLPEETPYQTSPVGRDFYCKSKYLAEEEVKRAAAEGRIEFVILRPGIILGDRDSSVTRRIASMIRERREIFNVGNLEEKIQLNYAEDVARGIILAGIHGPANQAYNVCSPPEMSKFEFWSQALIGLGLQRRIGSIPYPMALAFGYIFESLHAWLGDGRIPMMTLWSVYLMGNRNLIDGSKISKLGWIPSEAFGNGIERTFSRFRGPRTN